MRRLTEIVTGDVFGLEGGDSVSPGWELRWGATLERAQEAWRVWQYDREGFLTSEAAVRALSNTSRQTLLQLSRVRNLRFWARLRYTWRAVRAIWAGRRSGYIYGF